MNNQMASGSIQPTGPCPATSRRVEAPAAERVQLRPAVSSSVQQRPATSSAMQNAKTNPKPPAVSLPNSPSLTPRQLAAARLLILGMGSAEVARRVGTTQRSVNRWKSSLPFQSELMRMHDLLLTMQIQPHQQTLGNHIVSHAPRSRVASDAAKCGRPRGNEDQDREDPESEKWVNDMFVKIVGRPAKYPLER
jgi:hypothetical protein